MAYKFQLGAARLSGSTTFEEALAIESTVSSSGDLSLGADIIMKQSSNLYLAGDGGAAKIVSTGGNAVSIFGANLVTNGAAILPDSDGGTNLGSPAKQFSTSFQSGLASLDGGINVNDDFTVDTDGNAIAVAGTFSGLASLDGGINVNDDFTVNTDGAVTAVGVNAGGALSGVTTLAASGLASVASISMDDGSTLGPDSVAGLWTFSAAGDTTQADGAYDFDLASHDGTNGLKLGGVLVNASAADLNFTNVAAAGTAEASKALVVDASRNIANVNQLTASVLSASNLYGNGSGLTDISSDSVDVADSSADSEFRLVGVAASGDGVSLVTMDTAADLITMNASTGKLTLAGPGIAIGSADITEAEFEFLDGATAGTAVASKALVVDASKDLASLNDVSAAGLTLSDLTSGRVLLAGTSGLLEDNADLAYNGSVLMVKSKDGQSGSIYSQTGSIAVLNAAGNGVLASLGNDGVISGSGNFETAGQLNAASSIYSGANIEAQGNLSASADLELTDASRITAPGVSLNKADLLQIDGITAGTVAASKAVVVDSNKDIASFRHLTAAGAVTAGTSFVIGSADLNEADMEKLDGITNGTAAASKAVVLDASKDISGLNDVQAAGLILSASSGGFQSSDLVFGTTASPLGRLRTYDDDGYITELSSEGGLDLSGSEGIAALMPSGYDFLVVGTGTHSLMLGDLDDNYNVELSSAGAISGSSTLKVGGAVTMAGLGTSTVALGDDMMIINDGASGAIKNTSLANYSTAIAGAGLLSTAGIIAVVNNTNGGINVAADAISIDFNDLSAASVNVAADSFAFLDADGNVTQKESIADLATAMAGTGITATNGQFSVSQASTPTAFGDEAATMVEGLNYASAALTAARVLTLPDSDDLDVGEFVKIKLAAGVSATNYASIVIDVGSGDLIDGDASIRLESPYAAVDLYKVAANTWRIL